MKKDDKIYIASHEGMIGNAVLCRLTKDGFKKLITRTTAELDLTDQKAVLKFFLDVQPDYVFLTTTKIGGILANSRYPAEFIYINLQIQSNVINAAWKAGVKKLLFWGSSCIYPKDCLQPMKEEYLLTGKLEPNSEPYAIAKIAGIEMCASYNRQYGTNYISVVPADLYGPDDDFSPETGHFLPALIDRIHEAKINNDREVSVWGTGSPRRECLHVDDLADASVFLMDKYNQSDIINVGSGRDYTIQELAYLIRDIIGYKGNITFDKSKSDGAPQKLLDISRIKKLGWSPKTGIENGIRQTYQWYLEHVKDRTYGRKNR